jgi:archaellum component FlaC
VHGGLDIGAETVVVATPDGTNRYRNAARAVENAETVAESSLTVQVDDAVYAIDDASADVTGGEPLFGADSREQDVTWAALTALVGSDDARNRPLGAPAWGYVDRDPATREGLSRLATGRSGVVVPVHPGMAVCYDSFDGPPNGLGVALDDGIASAALTVSGVPVATATIDYQGRWYDVTDATADVGTGGVRAAWHREQYRALLADVAAALAARGPAAGPMPVVLGGAAAPPGLAAADLGRVEDALGLAVESVTVADAPADAPAWGALTAARSDARSGPVPAFAATEAYAPGRADIEAATAAFADALDATGALGATTRNRADPGDEGGRVGLALGGVVDGLDRDLGRLRGQVDEVSASVDAVADDLASLNGQTADRETVEELAAQVERTESRLDDLADDVAAVQAVLAGLDGESGDESGTDAPADVPDGAFESVAVDALRNDIDAVESDLVERIEALWAEIDRVDDRLVDRSARLDDLPELESAVESTRSSVEDVSGQVAELRRSLTALEERLDETAETMATTEELGSLADELDRVDEQVETLREQLRGADWVEPAELDSQARDLDALRETVVDHARRLEAVEQSTGNLDDRLERAFRDTAKAEALSSLQSEVSRLQQQSTDDDTGVSGAEVDALRDEIAQVRQMVDSVAERSVTRSELAEQTDTIESRLAEVERHEPQPQPEPAESDDTFVRGLLTVALVCAAGLGVLLALGSDRPAVALGFVVLVAGPAALLWLPDRVNL